VPFGVLAKWTLQGAILHLINHFDEFGDLAAPVRGIFFQVTHGL
jgi:hypothetical protein